MAEVECYSLMRPNAYWHEVRSSACGKHSVSASATLYQPRKWIGRFRITDNSTGNVSHQVSWGPKRVGTAAPVGRRNAAVRNMPFPASPNPPAPGDLS
jgi:hypothetical protein